MIFLKKHIVTILIVICAVFITLQVSSMFRKSGKPEQMIRNEERLKYLEESRLKDSVTIVITRALYDSAISASNERLNQLQNKFQATKIIYEKVPVIINNLDREQLRRAVSEF